MNSQTLFPATIFFTNRRHRQDKSKPLEHHRWVKEATQAPWCCTTHHLGQKSTGAPPPEQRYPQVEPPLSRPLSTNHNRRYK
jgi:hypothetical protein